MTLDELREKLLDNYDPDDIISALDISSEELLDRFEDKLIDKLDKLEGEFEDE